MSRFRQNPHFEGELDVVVAARGWGPKRKRRKFMFSFSLASLVFIHLPNKYLLSDFYVSGTELSLEIEQ